MSWRWWKTQKMTSVNFEVQVSRGLLGLLGLLPSASRLLMQNADASLVSYLVQQHWSSNLTSVASRCCLQRWMKEVWRRASREASFRSLYFSFFELDALQF